jgi:branched-chain amino acid transport system permease protein
LSSTVNLISRASRDHGFPLECTVRRISNSAEWRFNVTHRDLPADRGAVALARFEERTRLAIRPLITKKVIAEHRRDPLGDHSDTLKRVLNYLRRASALAPYVIVCTKPFREWRVARMSGERGKAPNLLDERKYKSEVKAMHALFLKRLEEVLHD